MWKLAWYESPDNTETNGRILDELGAALKGHVNVEEQTVFGGWVSDEFTLTELCRMVAMHDKWQDDAMRAIQCWVWAARKLGVAKDIRCLIARALWRDRWAWCIVVKRSATERCDENS